MTVLTKYEAAQARVSPAIFSFVTSEGVMSSSKLFDDLKDLTDHQVELTVGSVRPPKQLRRFGHPALKEFPSIDGVAYEALKEDIRQNGQKFLISMRDGYIWNGRARYRACLELNLLPKLDLHRRGDPVEYLMANHHPRYGQIYSPEWVEVKKRLDYIRSREWKGIERNNRSAWTGYARHEFKQHVSQRQPCAVCRMSSEYSHAHHSLPLNIQYDLGIEEARHVHDWLCPVHHKLIHQILSPLLLGTRRGAPADALSRYPDKAAHERGVAAMKSLVLKAYRLFVSAGGWPFQKEPV